MKVLERNQLKSRNLGVTESDSFVVRYRRTYIYNKNRYSFQKVAHQNRTKLIICSLFNQAKMWNVHNYNFVSIFHCIQLKCNTLFYSAKVSIKFQEFFLHCIRLVAKLHLILSQPSYFMHFHISEVIEQRESQMYQYRVRLRDIRRIITKGVYQLEEQ